VSKGDPSLSVAGPRVGGYSVGWMYFRRAAVPPTPGAKTSALGMREGCWFGGDRRGFLVIFSGRRRGPRRGLGVLLQWATLRVFLFRRC
jgi:hypothetical protein